MFESIVFHQVVTLSSLPRPRPSHNEVNHWRIWLVDVRFCERSFEINIDLLPILFCVNSYDLSSVVELLDYWNSFIRESSQSLFDCFRIVICSAAGLSTLCDAINHTLFAAFEVDEVANVNFMSNNSFEGFHVLLVSWKAINEVAS